MALMCWGSNSWGELGLLKEQLKQQSPLLKGTHDENQARNDNVSRGSRILSAALRNSRQELRHAWHGGEREERRGPWASVSEPGAEEPEPDDDAPKPKPKENDDVLQPKPLHALRGRQVAMVAAGDSHTLVLDAVGNVWSCGRNREGQLGVGVRTVERNDAPQHITALESEVVTQVACGSLHSIAVTRSGKLFVWGLLHMVPEDAAPSGSQPSAGVTSAEGVDVVSGEMIGMTDTHSDSRREYLRRIVEASQALYDAGSNQNLSAGLAMGSNVTRTVRRLQTAPVLMWNPGTVPGHTSRALQAAGGYSYTIFCTEDSQVWGFGYNDQGQLGLGHRSNAGLPARVETLHLAGVRARHVAAGQQHSVVLSEEGHVYTFGSNAFGQIGRRVAIGTGEWHEMHTQPPPLKPARVLLPEGACGVHADCGSFHTCVVTADGRVYVWGHSEYGQLGPVGELHGEGLETRPLEELSSRSGGAPARLAAKEHTQTPQQVVALEGVGVAEVACGGLFTMAVCRTGRVYSWGWGAGGALGHGSARFCLQPTQVAALPPAAPVLSLAAGGKHSLAVVDSDTAGGLRRVLESEALADVEVRVGGGAQGPLRRFRAHWFVVAARCPALAARIALTRRFCPPPPELPAPAHAADGTQPAPSPRGGQLLAVHLPEFRADAFEAVLEHLYLDTLPQVPWHARKALQAAAEILRLPRLLTACGLTHPHTLHRADQAALYAEQMRRALQEGLGADLLVRGRAGSSERAGEQGGEASLLCHRAVLASQSDFFAAMFTSHTDLAAHSTQELLLGEECSVEVFTALVECLYTGSLEALAETPNIAVRALALADQYMIEPLKQRLELLLIDAVDSDSAAWLRDYADVHNAPRLKEACSRFCTGK